jgi:DNA-binding transcriptional LysR family regulator
VDLLRQTSWDALIAFAEFAEARNFTRAAQRLHLSQPALHTKIANLSAALGRPLYLRRGREIEITEAGRKVERFAREMARSAAEFASELTGDDAGPPVVLAAGEGAYLYLLGAGLRSFRSASRHPLQLQTANGPAALEAICSARAHIGIAALERTPRGLVVEPYTRVGQVLAVPHRHALADRGSLKIKALRDLPLILPPEGRPHRSMVSQALQSAGIPCVPAIEANGWELMLSFVQLGFGAAIVNDCCRMPAGVVALPLPDLPQIQFHLFHPARGISRPAVSLKEHLLRSRDAWRARSR